MKSGVGSAPGGCTSTGAFNVPVRKKRGRTAPPSSRCLRGKKDDNVMGSDDANHASNVEATAVKKTTVEDKYSQAIMDDVYKAEMNSTSSDDESDEEVQDVKVCDICGDVGDEEKLAVCNRCNDGAEHIYCMRVMMENVPEGEWFCEECQAEVDFEKKKLEKSQVKVGTSKEESTEGKISKPVNAVQSRSSCENEVDAETVGREEWNEANQGIDTVTRRKEEDARIMPVAKQSIPEPVVLSTGSDSRRRIPLSRDNSFRLAMEKGKQPTPQVPTLLASSAAKNQAPPFAGQLSKSTSFNNSKVPKVKQLVIETPHKTQTLKAQLTCSVKREGPMGLTTKSATFKKPKTCETAIKAKSSIIPPAEELPVRRNASNDRGTSILGCPSITGPMALPVQSKAESAAQRLTTGNNTANSSNLGVANEQGVENTLGNSELNKPLLAKAPVSITSTSSERSLGILGSGAQRNVFQNSEASHSEFCSTDRLRLSAIEPPSERNLKDASAKKNGMSEANSLVATMSSDLMDKLSQAFSPGDKTMVSTVPELDYIWQGDFELWRTGRSPELCDGFQAHLSCSASPKVLEVAKKFPSRVQLEELPRQDSWPIQFQKNGPTYDSIGVFFFSRDTHSYEHHYSKLVQNMLNNDLALRGNIGTAELLIFPSNILSENSQRWNMFYFLWGVFRVKRKDHRNLPPDVRRSECQPNLNDDPVTMDLHTSVCSQSFSEDQNNGAKPDCNLVKSATCADHQCLQASEANHKGCSNGENSSGQPLGGTDLEDHCDDSARTCCLTNSRGSINGFSSAQTIKHKRANNRSRVVNFNNAESLMQIYDINSIEGNSGAVNHVSHASGGAQKRKVDTANWTGVNGSLDKKIKLDNISSPVESSLSENIRDGMLSSKVYPLAALSVDDCTDNKAMAGTSKCNGKCIFPLDLNVADDAVKSSDDEDLPEQNTQDQARAGGQHISSRKPIFLFSPMVKEKRNKGESLPADTSGAICLALPFPASKEQAGKMQSEPCDEL